MLEWTEGRKRSFITSVLRGGMRRWPPKWEALNKAKTTKKINIKTGRMAQHYKCKKCKGEFTSKDVQVDHIKPVVALEEGFISWDVFIERLYVDVKDLAVLCKPCHAAKTKRETKKRRIKV